jgi:hypothetical protein
MTEKQLVDFTGGLLVGGDTGENDDAAILPSNPGEPVRSVVLKRPGVNLQNRVQILRDLVENGLYRADADMKWIIGGGTAAGASAATLPTVSLWNPTLGLLEVGSNIVIQPLNTPPADKVESKVYTFGTGPTLATATFRTTRHAGTATTALTTSANRTRILWVETPGQSEKCLVTTSGYAPHVTTISLKPATTVTFDDLVAAIALCTTLGDAGLSFVPSVGTNPDITLPTGGDEDYAFGGTAEREMHFLLASTLKAFVEMSGNEFDATRDGDTIGIAFDTLEDRRLCRPNYCSVGTAGKGYLFYTNDEPELIPLAIPLVKRIGTALYWLDGTIVTDTVTVANPVYFGESDSTVRRINGYADVTQQAAYNPTGPFITADPISLSANPLVAQIQAICSKINNKGSLNAAETVTGVWTHSAVTNFTGGWQASLYGTTLYANNAVNGLNIVGTVDIPSDATHYTNHAFRSTTTISDATGLTSAYITGAYCTVSVNSDMPSGTGVRGFYARINTDAALRDGQELTLFKGSVAASSTLYFDPATTTVYGLDLSSVQCPLENRLATYATNNAETSTLALCKSASDTGAVTDTGSADVLGRIQFKGVYSSAWATGAEISVTQRTRPAVYSGSKVATTLDINAQYIGLSGQLNVGSVATTDITSSPSSYSLLEGTHANTVVVTNTFGNAVLRLDGASGTLVVIVNNSADYTLQIQNESGSGPTSECVLAKKTGGLFLRGDGVYLSDYWYPISGSPIV